VAVEQVDVGRKREGGGVVAEPPLHLDALRTSATAARCRCLRGAFRSLERFLPGVDRRAVDRSAEIER
jgi:hypothetical protein